MHALIWQALLLERRVWVPPCFTWSGQIIKAEALVTSIANAVLHRIGRVEVLACRVPRLCDNAAHSSRFCGSQSNLAVLYHHAPATDSGMTNDPPFNGGHKKQSQCTVAEHLMTSDPHLLQLGRPLLQCLVYPVTTKHLRASRRIKRSGHVMEVPAGIDVKCLGRQIVDVRARLLRLDYVASKHLHLGFHLWAQQHSHNGGHCSLI